MISMVAEQKSHICLEDDNISATDRYFNLQSIYTRCLEGENMKFQKGMIPWNKNKKWYEMSGDNNPSKRPEVRKKISEAKRGNKARLGMHNSEEHCKKISIAKMGVKNPMFGKHRTAEQRKKTSMAVSGANHPLYGTHRSEETREKISKANKGRTSKFKGVTGRFSEQTIQHMSQVRKGRKLSEEAKNKLKGRQPWNKGLTGIIIGRKNPMYGKKHSEETKHKQSECRIGKYAGENHPMWRGGASFKPYCYKFNNQLKEAIRNRDNRTCQLCDEKENGERLSVHHIHYDKENCYPDLIALCRKCNSKVDKKGKTKYYEELFMNKLNEKGLLLWVRYEVS